MSGQLNAQFGLNTEQADAAILKTDANIKKLTTSLQQLDEGFGVTATESTSLGAATDQLSTKTEKQIGWVRQARMEHRQTAYAMREGREVMMLSMVAMMALMNTDENASKKSKELNKTLMETVMAFQAMRFVMYSLQDNAGFAGLAAKMGMSAGGLGMAISAIVALGFGLISFLKNQTSTTKELNDELAKQYDLEVKLGMIKLPQQVADAQKKVNDAQKDYNELLQKREELQRKLGTAEKDYSDVMVATAAIRSYKNDIADLDLQISQHKTTLETAQVALKGLTDEQKKSDDQTKQETKQIIDNYENVKEAAYQARVAAGLVGENTQMKNLLADQKQLVAERNSLTYQSAMWYEWDKKVSDNLAQIHALQKQIDDEKKKTVDSAEKEVIKEAEIATQKAKVSDYAEEQTQWSIATLHALEGQATAEEDQLKIEGMIKELEDARSKRAEQRKKDADAELAKMKEDIKALTQYKVAASAVEGALGGLWSYMNIGMRDAKNVWDSIWLGMERSAIETIERIAQEWIASKIMQLLFPGLGLVSAATGSVVTGVSDSNFGYAASGGDFRYGSNQNILVGDDNGRINSTTELIQVGRDGFRVVPNSRMLAMKASLGSIPSFSGGGFVGSGSNSNSSIVNEIRALNNKLNSATLKADRSGLWVAWNAEDKMRTRLTYGSNS
jgi:hypothetical protein